MERTKLSTNGQPSLATLERIGDLVNRTNLARKMGWQYGNARKLYEALGYPEESELDFKYYWNKYDRQDIAKAVIDKPVDATWDGEVAIMEEGGTPQESVLGKAWSALEKEFKVKSRLVKVDKLTGIGQFGLLLFGFNDVKEIEDWKDPVVGKKKLLYLKQIPENSVSIDKWENDSSKERYGMPLLYKITVAGANEVDKTKDILVHYSRTLHIVEDNLTSETYGTPRLKPIINRLNDLDKILGGSAEMYWRGARPGYHASAKDDYEMGKEAEEALAEELDKYEHDLRRFISAKGVDINALETQVADPSNHVDTQIQAISAETGIPKRVLLGSERGELASTQDKDAWLTLVDSRMTEFAEPMILRPFIDKCMEHGILPTVKEYVVLWEDVFAPSEKQKVEVGKQRADALKVYADSPFASEILPPALAYKYLLGLTDDQAQEIEDMADLDALAEDKLMKQIEDAAREEERLNRTRQPGAPPTTEE